MDVSPALTAEHLDPWNGNIVDLTMLDGTHRIGLLQRVDRNWVRLKTGRGEPSRGTIGMANSSPQLKPPRCAMLSMLIPVRREPALIEKPITREPEKKED